MARDGFKSLTSAEKELFIDDAANGETLKRLKTKYGLTNYAWTQIQKDVEFMERLNTARMDAADDLADTLLEIPDTYDDPMRARLKSDNIKWILSKRKPLVYGDKIQLDIHQKVDISLALNEARSRLRDVSPKLELPTNQDHSTINDISTDSKSVAIEIEPLEKDVDPFS